MYVDAREYDAPTLDTDLCIVGGGAAGLSLANALQGSGLHVTVVESGGRERAPDTDALNEADSPSIGGDYLLESRRRVLGGTTSHWTGMCLPLDTPTFEVRPWMADSGWPFGAELLHPYYVRACEQLGLVPWARDGTLARDPELAELPLSDGPAPFTTRTYQVKRRFDFARELGPALEQAPTITVLLNATCTALGSQGDRVTGAVVQTLTGKTVTVRAKAVVLAAGGIENARLLLLANEARPGALGTGHEVVGRYYMDHPELVVAEAVLWPSWDLDLYMRSRLADERLGFGAFFPTHRYQREARLLETGIQLAGGGGRWGVPEHRELDRAVASAGFYLDCVRGVSQRDECLPAAERTVFFARCEQAPESSNRVALGDRRDAFGNRLPTLQWRLGERDYASIRTTTLALGKALYRSGVGRFRPLVPEVMPDDLRTVYGFGFDPEEREARHRERKVTMLVWGHHMGTTRMADHPDRGVVDSDCRVHGVANLYVAGSSVFPTGGAANPTLTIVALALRLADHLAAGVG